MTEPTNTQTVSTNRSIPERITVPLLSFSGVLALLLVLSWTLILPRFTAVNVQGDIMTPREVVKYEQKLKAELVSMEQTRKRLVLPVHDETYESLKAAKSATVTSQDVLNVLHRAAAATGEAQAIVFTSWKLSSGSGAVALEGDVRDVGPRSMTILAAFIEELGKEPTVRDLTRPSFSREKDPKGAIHSPFAVTFTLDQHAQ